MDGMYCGVCVKRAQIHLILPKVKYEETAKLYPNLDNGGGYVYICMHF